MSRGLLPAVRQAPPACIPPQPNQQSYWKQFFMTPFVLSGQDILLSFKSLRSYRCQSSRVLSAQLQTALRKASRYLEVSRSAHVRCTELESHHHRPARHSWFTFSTSTTHSYLAVQPGSGFGPKILKRKSTPKLSHVPLDIELDQLPISVSAKGSE